MNTHEGSKHGLHTSLKTWCLISYYALMCLEVVFLKFVVGLWKSESQLPIVRCFMPSAYKAHMTIS